MWKDWPCPNKYYPHISLVGLRETKNLNQDCRSPDNGLNLGSPE
jgi:hypothetical protein